MSAESSAKSGVLRLLWRRWWVAYLLLVAASNLWPRAEAPEAKQPFEMVPAMSDAGPIAGREMRAAYAEWGASERPSEADRPEASATGSTTRLPVILIHGSPGSGSDFWRMGEVIAADGRWVIAPDLPGFGESERNPPAGGMSILAHARAVLAVMDRLGVQRAHVVGWSLGGGVALHMAQMAPERLASLTLLASVGAQEDEGSGSYWFEHGRYAAGWALTTALRYGVPHFGLLDGIDFIRASTRNFRDSDQRPLRAIMERLSIPTLVLAGRHDFLVRDWVAQREFEIIPASRLVMLNAMHFMPFLEPEETSAHLVTHFRRHDNPGVPPLRQTADLAPRPPPMFGTSQRVFEMLLRDTAWWILAPAAALLVRRRTGLGAALIALAVAAGKLDYGVALVGMIAGQAAGAYGAWRRGRGAPDREVIGSGLNARGVQVWARLLGERPWRSAWGSRFVPGAFDAAWEAIGAISKPTRDAGPEESRAKVRVARRALPGTPDLRVAAATEGPRRWSGRAAFVAGAAFASLVWAAFWLIVAAIAYVLFAGRLTAWLGTPGFIAAAALTGAAPSLLALLLTREGRRLLRMRFGRARRREYWPAAVMYLLLGAHFARLTFRHRAPLVFTACNPGIPSGGGIIGESKTAIMDALGAGVDDGVILASRVIPAGDDPERRARRAIDAILRSPELGGLPAILKPDSGYRGFAVKLARTERDVRDYFRVMTAPAIVQRYHPGPCECGILWARCPDRGFENNGELHGSIFSICRKDFPFLVGDGRRTIEDLIQDHPRFRYQAAVFLERWAGQRRRVLGPGETLRLAEAGNHCQGTLFRDGADLITPALEARIDAIARRFALRDPGRAEQGGLDIGRFDVRYESDEALREGRGFAILELNGTTGESTNIYDPERSALWAYGVLARQWSLMYELGARRRAMGTRPVTVAELFAHARKHFATRAGSPLAD